MQEIEKGSFRKVYKAELINSKNRRVAYEEIVYILDSTEDTNFDSFKRSLYSFTQIQSINILKVIGIREEKIEKNEKLFLTTMYLKKGSLRNVLEIEPNLASSCKLHLANGIANGLFKLHEYKIIHKSIRLDNILVTNDFTAKICYMEFLKPFSFEKPNEFSSYFPPEYFFSVKEPTKKFDIYMFGLLLNKLFGGTHLLETHSYRNGKLDQKAYFFDFLINECVQYGYQFRPDASECKQVLKLFQENISQMLTKDEQLKATLTENEMFLKAYKQILEQFKSTLSFESSKVI